MYEFFREIAANHILRVAFFSWLIAQGLKVPMNILLYGNFDLKRFIGSGGMPSSHTALVVSLAVSTGLTAGWDSPSFAIALVVAGVVMYDAAGVRREAGKQAEAINQIVSDIYQGKRLSPDRLKELIGHSPVEVLAGAILGLILGLVL